MKKFIDYASCFACANVHTQEIHHGFVNGSSLWQIVHSLLFTLNIIIDYIYFWANGLHTNIQAKQIQVWCILFASIILRYLRDLTVVFVWYSPLTGHYFQKHTFVCIKSHNSQCMQDQKPSHEIHPSKDLFVDQIVL